MADGFQARFVDLVRNTTTTTGTDDFALGPAVNGYNDLAAVLQAGETFYYAATGIDTPAEFEVGRGTLLSKGVVARDPLGGAKTNFSKGIKSVALIASSEWFEAVETLRSSTTNVRLFGAKGDSDAGASTGTDDTAAFQAAIDAIGARAGGTLIVPDGYYRIDGGCLRLCRNLRVEMSAGAYLVTSRAGGGGASPDEDVSNGSMFFGDWPSNASNAVNVTIQGGNIACTNPDNVGAAFYDNCGAFVKLHGVNVTGFKYGVIFDQTECSDVLDCNIYPADSGGACVWLVNKNLLKAGNMAGLTNRISLERNQLNGNPSADLVRDDGGAVHNFADNNYNGGLNQLRLAGVEAFTIRGGEFEGSSGYPILFHYLASDGTTGVGPAFGVMNGGIISPGLAGSCVQGNGASCSFSGVLFATGGYAVTAAQDGAWRFLGCSSSRSDGAFTDTTRCFLFIDSIPTVISDNLGLGTFTPSNDHLNHRMQCKNRTSNSMTIQNDATRSFPTGSFFELEQVTATGTAAFVADTGVTVTGPASTGGLYQRLKATKVAANSWQTELIVQRPLDNSKNLADLASASAAVKNLQTGTVLAQSAAPSAHTGDTAKFTLASVTLPANSLGANGQLVVEALFSSSSTNSNAKAVTVEIGGMVVLGANIASNFGTQLHSRVANRGAPNSQIYQNAGITGYGGNNPQTGAIDTTVDQTIAFTVTLASATDTVKLESYQILLYPKD